MKRKVVAIGLDGADWRLLTPWIQQGELPTLARLVAEGASGPLRSTIRPESSVAWSSFATGVNPGKHAVFGFVHHEPDSYRFQLANGTTIAAPRFWDFLSQHQRKVGLLNVPFTYPPTAVNGFMVSGMLTPSVDVSFTYPKDLQEQLVHRFEDYRLDAGEVMTDKAKLVENARAYTEQQLETALLLMQKYDWDFFTVVFTSPDRLQHMFWADMDINHPRHLDDRDQFGQVILDHYRQLDAAIKQIWDQLPPKSLLLIMSDHGFNSVARRFYVNRWLRAQGLLTLYETNRWRVKLLPLLTLLKSVPILRRIKRAILPNKWGPAQMQVALFIDEIDWTQTKAYYAPNGGIYINLRGREPHGSVLPGAEYDALRQELRQSLLMLDDLATGERVMADVFLREALYSGPFAAQAPDLILEPQRNHPNAAYNFILDGSLPNSDQSNIFGSSEPYSGNHALDGILIAWGEGISTTNQIADAQIVDLAPTILASLDVPIPRSMDGRLLTELFELEHVPTPSYSDDLDDYVPHSSEKSFNEEQETAVASRLRGLGYLD